MKLYGIMKIGYTKTTFGPSMCLDAMNHDPPSDNSEARQRLAEAYRTEKPRLLARLRAVGRSLEEAEDLVHDVYVETMERLHLLAGIRNLPAWINSLFTRRLIDAWRHERVRAASGETDVAEDTLREIIAALKSAGYNGYLDVELLGEEFEMCDYGSLLGQAKRAVEDLAGPSA